MKRGEKVLGCRLTLLEWEDFEKFKTQEMNDRSNTAALRVLLKLGLTITGHCRDLWQDTTYTVPNGWFTNIMVGLAKEGQDAAAGDGAKEAKQAKKKPAKKPAKKPTKGGEA